MRLDGISIGLGNVKIGPGVYTFSLPSWRSCPGMSEWCKNHCYAHRYEKERDACRKAYEDNFVRVRGPPEFADPMIRVLPKDMKYFRIHVSGDFFSRDYIRGWVRICQAFPDTKFWGYTRSWKIPLLERELRILRDLPNVQLIASVDETMPLPPEGWRVAFITTDTRGQGLLCKTQTGEARTCEDCGYCFKRREGNVLFKIH